MNELDAGDPGADDHEVLGKLLGRVGVASGEDPLAVDWGPVGDARTAAGGQHDDIGFEIDRALAGVGHHMVGTGEAAGAVDQQSGTVLIELQAPNGDRALKPGAYAQVTLPVPATAASVTGLSAANV